MKTVVDTSALITLLYPDDEHNERASELLGRAHSEGATVANPVTYVELSADDLFGTHEELDGFFDDTGLRVEAADRDALFRAGVAFQEYLDARGETLQCPECGEETVFEWPSCGGEVSARQYLPADFIVGAHAEQQADALVTFDTGLFDTYFDVTSYGID